MTEPTINDIKELVRKELVKTKDEINRGVLDSIQLLKTFISIEEGTGRIVILNNETLTNTEKVKLLMVGKHIAALAEIIDSPEADIQIISDETGVLKTTLSAPLGDLVKKNVLLKDGAKYKFNDALIKKEVQALVEKMKK